MSSLYHVVDVKGTRRPLPVSLSSRLSPARVWHSAVTAGCWAAPSPPARPRVLPRPGEQPPPCGGAGKGAGEGGLGQPGLSRWLPPCQHDGNRRPPGSPLRTPSPLSSPPLNGVSPAPVTEAFVRGAEKPSQGKRSPPAPWKHRFRDPNAGDRITGNLRAHHTRPRRTAGIFTEPSLGPAGQVRSPGSRSSRALAVTVVGGERALRWVCLTHPGPLNCPRVGRGRHPL